MWPVLFLLVFSRFAYGLPGDGSFNPSLESTTFGLTGRIVNGTQAALRQFPHQVSLRRSWSMNHFCGGSIISNKVVLTAAHCMYNNAGIIQPWTIVVVGGIIKLNEKTSTRQERGVEKINIHPKYNIQNLHNDIAALQLSVPFVFTPEIFSVGLPTRLPPLHTLCQVSGWGYLASNIPIVSNDLMYVNLPIRSTEECRKLLVNVTDLPKGMFCAGYLAGGKDACQGDSGGGMVCQGILTGTVSGGEGCALPLFPGVYTDVFHYVDWILNNMDTNIAISKYYNFTNSTNSTSGHNYGEQKSSTFIIVLASFFFVLLGCIYKP